MNAPSPPLVSSSFFLLFDTYDLVIRMFPVKKFQHLASRAQKSKMAAMAVGGLANFFRMAPRVKMLVSII